MERLLSSPRPLTPGLPRSGLALARTGLVAIGASTGGVDALHAVLGRFPADCPPTVVVQHIQGAYSSQLVAGLDARCAPAIREAEDGAPLVAGTVYIAPGNEKHLTVSGQPRPICRLISAPRVSGHRPSVDRLFESCAVFGPLVRAAILTGMGGDGAEGLGAIRRAGGRTVGQDAASSVVFGMARVAHERGAVERLLPLDQIAAALLARGHGRREGRE